MIYLNSSPIKPMNDFVYIILVIDIKHKNKENNKKKYCNGHTPLHAATNASSEFYKK